MKRNHIIQRIIGCTIIGILPDLIWKLTMKQWCLITIPSLILFMCIMEAIQKPYDG
jgi:hypothetical protein